jgi:Fe-S oxidoreductase
MMLYLKSMLPHIPGSWRQYYLLKGRQDQSWLIALYDVVMRIAGGPLGKHVDKSEFEKKGLLFYFGCYVFSPSGSPTATLKLADRLGLDYEVLAGVRSCCGWPQYLTGQMGYGQQMLTHLDSLINKIEPKWIVTGCAECYAALLRLKKKTHASWTPLTTPEWLLEHVDELHWKKLGGKMAFHDSCHITKKAGNPQPSRKLLALMSNTVELYDTPEDCVCCGYYNIHANNDLNGKLHQEKLEKVKEKDADGMAVECVTCWESFHKPFAKADMPLWEIMVAAELATREEIQ